MIRAIVTDIEGTTSSLSFVKDVLFPYARIHMPDFVRNNQNDPMVKSLLAEAGQKAGTDLDLEQLIGLLIHWMDCDQKIAPLKSLQGLVWHSGYLRGDFNGHIYEDAARRLKEFKAQGYELYVYSSGSIDAQKLLFTHSEYGNLTFLFSGYFDTRTGGKLDTSSYRAIAECIKRLPEEILFLSDNKAELDAARQAGFATYWLVRGQVADREAEHRQIIDFDGIQL